MALLLHMLLEAKAGEPRVQSQCELQNQTVFKKLKIIIVILK